MTTDNLSSSDSRSSELTNVGWNFDNSYARLPARFFSRCDPTPVHSPQVAIFNSKLARALDLNLDEKLESTARLLVGNAVPSGAEPIAQAYAGHQYGGFTMLGDGRAILLGEQLTQEGARFDIQLKGSGPTPYSRRGDGRAALGPMLREYIVSEAMFALGVPTTRSLAVVVTGEAVYREKPLMGAVLTRIAQSHIRVGTFEYFAAKNDTDGVRVLADYSIDRHFPELRQHPEPYLALLSEVLTRQSALISQWMHVGFVHGVMNTDNMAISGETIDYGPCAFIDRYDESMVFSSIDRDGRYAYGNQSRICQWNLARFAETLLPLIDSDEQKAIAKAVGVLEKFPEFFQEHWLSGMRRKLGLLTVEAEDERLIHSLLRWMQRTESDYTWTMRALAEESLDPHHFRADSEFWHWFAQWQTRLGRNGQSPSVAFETMRKNNPAVIPRNHRVEEALKLATDHGDMALVLHLLEVLESPFDPKPEHAAYCELPPPSNECYRTFCGT